MLVPFVRQTVRLLVIICTVIFVGALAVGAVAFGALIYFLLYVGGL